MGRRATRRRGQRGAAAVEFALLVPLVLMLVFATMSYAYMFSFRQALSQAASEGARASVGASATGTCPATSTTYLPATCPSQSAAASAVARALANYGMTCNGPQHLACSISAPATCSGATGQCVSVTVSYPYRDHNLMPTVPGMGFTLPSSLSFTSTVVVR